MRPIDFCIAQLKAQGPSRFCNESKEEEEDDGISFPGRCVRCGTGAAQRVRESGREIQIQSRGQRDR